MSSNFRVITTKCLGVQIFRKFTVSLLFAVSNVLNDIFPWQNMYIIRGNIASATRKLVTFENCSNPASPILIVEGSWMDELGFYVPSTVFQSFRDDGRVNMKGSVQ